MTRTLAILCFILLLPFCSGNAQDSVLTEHNDNLRTGRNTGETRLTTAKVNVKHFGKLFAQPVDGFIVGQPLYVPNVFIPGLDTHNVVYVATQHDSVYAFDADSNQGNAMSPLWKTSFINPPQVTTVGIAQQGCTDNGYTEIGIMGTPVIDPSTMTLYAVAKTFENNSFIFRLHALDATTGQEKPNSPVVITATFVFGANVVNFSPLPHMQRPALLLVNGTLYVGFGSNGCDFGAHGWVMAYSASTLLQLAVFNSSPGQTYGGSVWQGGGGLSADSNGDVYFATANGAFESTGPDYGDSVLKMSLLGTSLQLVDYFTPSDQDALNMNDLDLASGGVVLLPDQPPPNPHLLVAAGKQGKIYLINRDNMGQFNSSDNVVQEIPGTLGKVFGLPAYFNNALYYLSTVHPLQAYALSNGLLSTSPAAKTSTTETRGTPSVSANGTSNAIVWSINGTSTTGVLKAFNALTLAPLYTSTQASNGRDTLGPTAHFATPTVANGKVFVGTQTQLVVYGLVPNLQVYSGANQTGLIGTTLPLKLKVKAVNPYTGAALAGIMVTFSDGGLGGTPNPVTAVTASDGTAASRYTLPNVAGVLNVTASASGFASAIFIETATQ